MYYTRGGDTRQILDNLWKENNLWREDKGRGPKVSSVRRFYCNILCPQVTNWHTDGQRNHFAPCCTICIQGAYLTVCAWVLIWYPRDPNFILSTSISTYPPTHPPFQVAEEQESGSKWTTIWRQERIGDCCWISPCIVQETIASHIEHSHMQLEQWSLHVLYIYIYQNL